MLYIVYWGACEPLGQSLVVPAVGRLAEMGVELTLVTFEKPADLAQPELVSEVEQRLQGCGVTWIRLLYHKRPQLIAKTCDVTYGISRGLAACMSGRPEIVHARTFLGGIMGLATAPLLGARLVFHNEGFYPDEQVDAGVWRKGSLVHRVARRIEDCLYRRADGLIALSRRAQSDILSRNGGRAVPTIVIPSAVDLARFRPAPSLPRQEGSTLKLVYVGAIGRRYLFQHALRFTTVALRETGNVHLRIVTRADPREVRQLVEQYHLAPRHWSLTSLAHSEMPTELVRHDAGLFFLTQGLSEHGCSPTKIGEYWASGLPVITTPNVGDAHQIIRDEHVGLILSDHTESTYRAAVVQLRELLTDPETPKRCRRAAETHYALEEACRRQLRLYSDLVSVATFA